MLTIVFFSSIVHAQTDIVEDIKDLYKKKAYDSILESYATNIKELPAKAVYYIGLTYYMMEDDPHCLEAMNLAIAKDPSDPDTYFIKGQTLLFTGNFPESIMAFRMAIQLDSSNANYYTGLGNAYTNLNEWDKALEAFRLATKQEEKLDRPYSMIPQILLEIGQPEKALEAFYEAKKFVSKESNSYAIILYNIGLQEFLSHRYEKAEGPLIELIQVNPSDYQARAKLIQVYYGLKQYEKAEPLRAQLYEAQAKGLLKETANDRFCFDQFEWNGKLVQVFERFEDNKTELYYKHLFYVLDEENNILKRIQTENSPIAIELGSGRYAIGQDKDNGHSTYGFVEDNFDYEKLKKYVIQILNEEVSPSASSTRGTGQSTEKEDKKKKKKK